MGTKASLTRYIVPLLETRTTGRVLDAFSGLGSVAGALAPTRSVVANDAMLFTSCLARARFLEPPPRHEKIEPDDAFERAFAAQCAWLRERFADRLAAESAAVSDDAALRKWVDSAPHVGNDDEYSQSAKEAAGALGGEHYQMVTLYFSASFFSTAQAIVLDSLRYAIDSVRGARGVLPGGLFDVLESTISRPEDALLAAWISTASTIMNSPGHATQYLRPTVVGRERVLKQWKRDAREIFVARAASVGPIGSRSWRSGNAVTVGDATRAVSEADRVGIVYADPPYTKDHYSRMYHVLETMYLYDYPDSLGAGRMRSDRFRSGFSVKTEVEASFVAMVSAVRSRGADLLLSYPSEGLLSSRTDVVDLVSDLMRVESVTRIKHSYSTVGASSGSRQTPGEEQLILARS